MHYMRINFATQGLTGKPAERGGSKVVGVNNAPMGLYPCAPGGPNDYVYIMTSRANPDHWDRLLKLIGREDLIGDKRYLTPADRVAREAEVDEIITAWTRQHTKHEAMRMVGDAGIPAGAVLDTMELQNDESFERRGIMQTMNHPVHRPFKMPGWPVRVDGKPSTIKPSPVLGQHTDHVLADWLESERGRGRCTARQRSSRLSESPALFEALIVPHRSLTRRGLRWVVGSLAGLAMLVSLRFWMLGAWPVLPFSVIEVGLVLLMLHLNTRQARGSELVILSETELRIVRTQPSGQRQCARAALRLVVGLIAGTRGACAET